MTPTDSAYHDAAARERPPGRYALLGVRVDPLTIPELNARIAEAIQTGRRRVIGCHNLHSVYLFHRDPKMREFYRIVDDIHIDGMAIVALGALLGRPLRRIHRVTWIDWLPPLLRQAAENGRRVFYLGSKPGVAAAAADALRKSYPGLLIETAHGYFDTAVDGAENQAVVERIRRYDPHIVMVGMGQPRQEKWVFDNYESLGARVYLTPGALFDYVAGDLPAPPRILGGLGLEWLYRLLSEPRRLWRRYLLEPWFLLGWFLRDVVRGIGTRGERG